MSYRRFNLILSTIIMPVVAVLASTGLFLQPYSGELTRLGGYPEKLYGWNAPQHRFVKPLYRQFKTHAAQYREPADVLVIGDSFTIADHISWPNYLAQKTGLRIQGFRSDKTPLEHLLSSATFREHPPRVLIYESVERSLWGSLHSETATCRTQPQAPLAPLATQAQTIKMESFQRNRYSASIDFSLSIDFLSKAVPREYFGYDRTPVQRFALLRDAPFSGVEKRLLLVYRDDLVKSGWTPAMWETIRCNLVEMQNRVQANGYTFFIALVAPDKLSAYSEWTEDRRFAHLSRIDLLAADPGLHLPRVDLGLKSAISDNVVDVYLNNDTHWGTNGYALVAREITDYLIRAGVLAPFPR